MSLFALSDLHIGFSSEKPMDIFGNNWENHQNKIKENWEGVVKEADTVVIAGDISWAMSLKDAEKDLSFIDNLKGNKILLKGNHDFWWTSLKKNCEAFPNINFLQNNHFSYEDYGICGSRGWVYSETAEDLKIYNREVNRAKISFLSAAKAGFRKFIFLSHFPIQGEGLENLLDIYRPEIVIFGHIHGQENFGMYENSGRLLTSCDYLNFKPRRVL